MSILRIAAAVVLLGLAIVLECAGVLAQPQGGVFDFDHGWACATGQPCNMYKRNNCATAACTGGCMRCTGNSGSDNYCYWSGNQNHNCSDLTTEVNCGVWDNGAACAVDLNEPQHCFCNTVGIPGGGSCVIPNCNV